MPIVASVVSHASAGKEEKLSNIYFFFPPSGYFTILYTAVFDEHRSSKTSYRAELHLLPPLTMHTDRQSGHCVLGDLVGCHSPNTYRGYGAPGILLAFFGLIRPARVAGGGRWGVEEVDRCTCQ